MGASRKLQGEIDRVLKKVQEGVEVFDSIWKKVYDTDNANQKEKFEADLKKEIKKLQRYRDQIKTWIQSSEIKDKKVSASYEQALVDARKVIEREMERFKICEKETKTKAFSKEGLGQQPKTDPKEKAKSETRDWLNNTVSELESQIDAFEAELEGLSVKKGKSRPPRMIHLEESIVRHKAHIVKLELILRLLDNDELSPEQVNDVKDFLDDYVERNQDDFDEFSDIEELYSTLPLDIEGLEVKSTPVLSMKTSLAASASSLPAAAASAHHQNTSHDQAEDMASQDTNTDIIAKTPPPKGSMKTHSVTTPGNRTAPIPISVVGNNCVPNSSAIVASVDDSVNSSPPAKEGDNAGYLGQRSTSLTDSPTVRGIGRGVLPNQPQSTIPLSSGNSVPSNGSHTVELGKRNIIGAEERLGVGGTGQAVASSLTKKPIIPQIVKVNEGNGSADSNPGEATGLAGRPFSPSLVSGIQWRPGSPFQSQSEAGPRIAPDQKENFLQRLQQVQQGHSNLLGISGLSGTGHKQFSMQQNNPLLQQFNPQSSSISPHGALGIGPQAAGFNGASLQQQHSQQPLISDASNMKNEEQQHNVSDDLNAPTVASTPKDDDSKAAFDQSQAGVSSSSTEPTQPDFSPGQPVQPGQPVGGSLGVIGRRNPADLGAIGDSISASIPNSGAMHDQVHNLQMLEASSYRLPQPKDSERPRHYIPRHPVATPASYPQVQAPIVNNPLLWERFGSDPYGTDTLFFTFYYQQNTYQQYLAAKELKKHSWRYHRKYNTWFMRHKEPEAATDEYEQGTYVYFDFYVAKDEGQHGWCQRIKTEFTFEYSYLEDELMV